jgi:membrane protein
MSESASKPERERLHSRVVAIVKEVYRIWGVERPAQFAAAMAYYAVFSLVPLIYIAFTVANLVAAQLATAEQFYARLEALLGGEMALGLQEAVARAGEGTTEGRVIASIVGFGALFYTASSLFSQLRHMLNTIWQVPPPKRVATRQYIRNQLLAFLMVLGVSGILILAAALGVLMSIVGRYVDLPGSVSGPGFLGGAALATLSFGLLFKVLPNARVAWKDVWIGAATSGLIVALVVRVMGLIVGFTRVSSALAAASTMTIVLTGFYVVGQILVLGALLTRVYATMYGSGIRPRDEDSE